MKPRSARTREVLERLAAAVVTADDVFFAPVDLKSMFSRLSPSDRVVLLNIARRVEEIRRTRGEAAAEDALQDVLQTLVGGRVAA